MTPSDQQSIFSRKAASSSSGRPRPSRRKRAGLSQRSRIASSAALRKRSRAQKISWSKENWSEEDPVETTVTAANAAFDVRECDFNVTHYYDENGNEITLNQGKTWVCIVRNAATNRVLISDDPYTDSSVIDGIG